MAASALRILDASFSRGVADLTSGPPGSSPRFRGAADGVPGWLDRLRALGNAVVPQVGMVPLARVKELDEQINRGPDPLLQMLEMRS